MFIELTKEQEEFLNRLARHNHSIQDALIIEEMSELTKAFMKCGRQEDTFDHVVEEACDVLITIQTLFRMHNVSDEEIRKWIDFKLQRTSEKTGIPMTHESESSVINIDLQKILDSQCVKLLPSDQYEEFKERVKAVKKECAEYTWDRIKTLKWVAEAMGYVNMFTDDDEEENEKS